MTPTNRCARALADMDADTAVLRLLSDTIDYWQDQFFAESRRRRHEAEKARVERERRYGWQFFAVCASMLPLCFVSVAPGRSIGLTMLALVVAVACSIRSEFRDAEGERAMQAERGKSE